MTSKLPPRWLRKIMLWPLPWLLVVIYVTTVPLLIIAALVLSYQLPGKLRLVRALGLATCYLFVEAGVALAALILWVGSGFGWQIRSPAFLDAHYRLFRWALKLLVMAARRLFVLDIVADGEPLPSDDGDDTTVEVPLIVMSRHAGPADSLLLLHEVMSWKGRRPRIVAKAVLQLDPALDIMLNRLPNRFISPNPSAGDETVRAIADLASGMTSADAFVIFPEGGNFTEGRRLRAIERLRAAGHAEAARRANALRNVLPPRPAGSLAAISACPGADVVFVAHTGLDGIATVADLWTAIPDHKALELAWNVLPAERIPASEQARIDMMFRAWEAIDRWIDENRAPLNDRVGNS